MRTEVLRKPLGLCFSKEYLEKEKDYIHFVGLKNGEVVAAASLIPEQFTYKMQQVAVRADMQGSGIDSGLMDYCEVYAKTQKFQSLYCHARIHAVPFYTKKGYLVEGEYFMEIGIPHVKMVKDLGLPE